METFNASIDLDEKILDAAIKNLKAKKQNKFTLRYYRKLAIYFTESLSETGRIGSM